MKIELILEHVKALGIDSFVGVPDSTLKELCNYLNYENPKDLYHYVPANEGAAVGMAAGIYLATGRPACVYMQNSGIGNAVNPIISLLHREVYDIPTLFLVGWRGEPGIKDEPQHVYQGKVTEELFELMGIDSAVITSETTVEQLAAVFKEAEDALRANRQFAIVVSMGSFEARKATLRDNGNSFRREGAIDLVLRSLEETDIVISTTGKISREVYECGKVLKTPRGQSFLTVGSMGHASMIALGIALNKPDKTICCIDGDGAALMHLGSMPFIGAQHPKNFIHVVLNNSSHESVGGMPTCAPKSCFAAYAKAAGYDAVCTVSTEAELERVLAQVKGTEQLTLIEVAVSLESRSDLGRPKEKPIENKNMFMAHLTKEK